MTKTNAASSHTVILDCYTDEPSGYGVRPYIGTHQINLSQALSHLGIDHHYITIDDLRYADGERHDDTSDNTRILNTTKNASTSIDTIRNASTIYIIMGCFIEYKYFACRPPTADEVANILKDTSAEKILFYVLGTSTDIDPSFMTSKLASMLSNIEVGNAYRYVVEGPPPFRGAYLSPNYQLLDRISTSTPILLSDIPTPIIAEIETGTGCNTPTCYYCIESVRHQRVIYRNTESIISQVCTLYQHGVRHFRLGRQPNFYNYARGKTDELERLLYGIRSACPELRMLHIDNVNAIDVIGRHGIDFTRLIVKYCTSGNIAPLGIESFDDSVRNTCGISGSADNIIKAIEIINEYGGARGDDGLPKFLPGINLIFGLSGETNKTHDVNMSYLDKIMTKKLMVRRLFYRKLTQPTGVTFSDPGDTHNIQYESNFSDIVQNFVMPMQSIVYPNGANIRGLMEMCRIDGTTYLRTFGTCSDRYRIDSAVLDRGYSYDIVITGNAGYRLLDAAVINTD